MAKLTVQEFLKDRHPAWNLVGRMHFNLAENRKDEDAPFAFMATYVLSVKAGGAGLNLTAASHVIHFDRWWNPAVENQATDRAFRIGQTRNVLVHKFVCQGTVEDNRVCREGEGLFPAPKEIKLSCSCPDWAEMCKHVAAVLYGVGARLDQKPALLFDLRAVDENELLANAGQELSLKKAVPATTKVLDDDDIAALFGLEMVEALKSGTPTSPERPQRRKTSRGPKTHAGKRAVAYKKRNRKRANWQETPATAPSVVNQEKRGKQPRAT